MSYEIKGKCASRAVAGTVYTLVSTAPVATRVGSTGLRWLGLGKMGRVKSLDKLCNHLSFRIFLQIEAPELPFLKW